MMRTSIDVHLDGAPVLCVESGKEFCWIKIQDGGDPYATCIVVFSPSILPEVLDRAAAAFNSVIAGGSIKQAAE